MSASLVCQRTPSILLKSSPFRVVTRECADQGTSKNRFSAGWVKLRQRRIQQNRNVRRVSLCEGQDAREPRSARMRERGFHPPTFELRVPIRGHGHRCVPGPSTAICQLERHDRPGLRVQMRAIACDGPAECPFVDNLQWLVPRQVCHYPLNSRVNRFCSDKARLRTHSDVMAIFVQARLPSNMVPFVPACLP